jgi:glycine cleavage system transcriptional repressor
MLILTAVGPDKPGMAHALARILFESGCNIEDTTMTRLSGQFSMILVVEPPESVSVEDLTVRTGALRFSHGLVVDVTEAIESPTQLADSPRYMLTAYGPENTGLLARLTGVLADLQVNVTDVQTRVASAGTVYVMFLEIELPLGLESEALEAELQESAPDLQISLRAIDVDTL